MWEELGYDSKEEYQEDLQNYEIDRLYEEGRINEDERED